MEAVAPVPMSTMNQPVLLSSFFFPMEVGRIAFSPMLLVVVDSFGRPFAEVATGNGIRGGELTVWNLEPTDHEHLHLPQIGFSA